MKIVIILEAINAQMTYNQCVFGGGGRWGWEKREIWKRDKMCNNISTMIHEYAEWNNIICNFRYKLYSL